MEEKDEVDEISYLDSVGIKETYMKNLKRVVYVFWRSYPIFHVKIIDRETNECYYNVSFD